MNATISNIRTASGKQSTLLLCQCCIDGFCRADFSPHKQSNRLLMLPHSGLKSALQGSIAVWIVSFFLTFSAMIATANPNGGQVVAGDASISSQGNRLDINQNSHKAIIDWRSFNISQDEQTNFKQPAASALTLNRVRGGQLSQINGQLNANGQVFLINPQGVIFGPNAQVTTGGLVATTADIRNDDFISGNYQFDQASLNANASIINHGHITTNDGGAIVLAAPTVNNEGTIQARLGSVNLTSANTFTLDFHGDGLLSFEVQGQITQKPDSVQDDAALVNNSGTIIADGGTVTLTAQAADAVIDRVINMDGIIQTKTLGENKGESILAGGDHGIVDVSGTLDVSGAENNETGGVVHVLGEKVGLFDGTLINAEGYAGGGEVLVGGNFQGKGSEPNAKRTYVAKNTKINASATKTGDGGKVIVWADETTQYYGDITARGGEQSGDGGFVEVSGKQNLSFNGTVAVNSILGQAGTLLLDPGFIEIQTIGDEDSLVTDNNLIAFDDFNVTVNETFTISAAALEALNGVVRLQAEFIIDINEDLDLQNLTTPNSHKIIFQSGGGINVNANIETSGGDLHIESGLTTLISNTSSNIFVKEGKNINTKGGNITLVSNHIVLETDSEINAGAGQINIAMINNIDDSAEGPFDTELIALDMNIGSNLTQTDSDLIRSSTSIFANDFNQIKTKGKLILGRATLAGEYGLGATLNGATLTGGDEILTPKIFINADTTFNSNQVILEATDSISVNSNIQGLNQTSIQLKAPEIILSSTISTEGNSVEFEGNTSIDETVVIDTTFNENPEGANITFKEPISKGSSGTGNLTLNAGTIGKIIGEKLVEITNLLISQSQSTLFSDSVNADSLDISAVNDITVNGSLTVGGTANFNAENGSILLNNPQNDFQGTVSLNNQGLNNIDITAANTLTLSTSNIGTGDLTITGSGITQSGAITQSPNAGVVTINAGAGIIDLANPANNITGSLLLNNNGNNNVNVINNAPLILGTSNVGNGQFNITGTQISQTGAITQETSADTTSFSASTGILDLTQNNDFTSTVSLNNIGTNDINIVDINTLNLGASSIETGDFTVTAGDLNIVGSVLNTGGSLSLQPFTLDQNISINSDAGSFSLSAADIFNLQGSFSAITIGRPGLTGNIMIDNATFTDPLIVQADGPGGSITINGVLSGTDDASITLNGSGNTTFLNGNILTAGNTIIINDAVILGNTVLLDTTSSGAFTGAGITLNGTVNRGAALTPLTLSAGSNTGDILFTGDVGVNTLLGDVTVLSANNITMNGLFLANDTRLTFSGLWLNNGNLPLDVNSLFVTPLAQGATVFGSVNSRGGLFAASEVTGVSNDSRYTINGCVMGVFCGIPGISDTNKADIPAAKDISPVVNIDLMNVWERQKRLQDPREKRYSNLGNEELWWNDKRKVSLVQE